MMAKDLAAAYKRGLERKDEPALIDVVEHPP
jgi:hypothetical protein